MQTPLSIHALFHSQNPEGQMIYTNLYSLLCRDVQNPFSDGLDIPVYFTSGDDTSNLQLVSSSSFRKVILVFIDINMFCSDNWRKFIDKIVNDAEADSNTLVVGVKLYRHAFSLNKKLGEIQSIVVDDESDKGQASISLFNNNKWEVFKTRLFDVLLRFLSDRKDAKQLVVFISHSKWDKSNKGELMAKEVRKFLYSDTKLNSFFDVHDILDGYKFDQQIKNHIKNSVLLVLFTDSYSSREWCRKEVLTAKENQVPIVATHMLEGMVDRTFPYVGNVPSISFSGDWRIVINLLLRTALDQYIEQLLLGSIKTDHKTETIPYPPEAFNMSLIKEDTEMVLYPEPPLGNEELDVLKNIAHHMGHDIQFITPMSCLTENLSLDGKKIGISVSESPDYPAIGVGDEMYRDLTIELSRHILKASGYMVYGGDLRKNGYTELFKELSNQYGQKEKATSDVFYFDNYLSWPISNNVTLEQKAEYLNSRINLIQAQPGDDVQTDEYSIFVPPTSLDNRMKWASSLFKMRSQMAQHTFARIIVGGKVSGFCGYMPGIAEEFQICSKLGQPIYLIGGFGGVAQILTEIIEHKATSDKLKAKALEKASYGELYSYCESNGKHIDYEYFNTLAVESLNNGLTPEQNYRLFHSVDIIEIVSLVLLGLKNMTR